MTEEESDTAGRGEVARAQEMAVFIERAVGFDAPAQQGRTPRGEPVGPGEPKGDPAHPKPTHGREALNGTTYASEPCAEWPSGMRGE